MSFWIQHGIVEEVAPGGVWRVRGDSTSGSSTSINESQDMQIDSSVIQNSFPLEIQEEAPAIINIDLVEEFILGMLSTHQKLSLEEISGLSCFLPEEETGGPLTLSKLQDILSKMALAGRIDYQNGCYIAK